jgi:heterodisulfide reductase subunit A-like polyferredoxin
MKSLVYFTTLVATAAAAPVMHHARIVERAEVLAEEYDFVVIGAGTAGLTLADRLTEDGKSKVFFIEKASIVKPKL